MIGLSVYDPRYFPPTSPITKRVVVGKDIKALRVNIRHLAITAVADFSEADNQTHFWTVPAGKYWKIHGGVVNRTGCSAALTVSVYSEGVQRRRLVVQTAGTSDTIDIPNNAIYKNNVLKPIPENDRIRVYFGADVSGDTAGGDPSLYLTVAEYQAK